MSILINIKEYPQTQKLLLNEHWRATEYYELCCSSELWGCAFLVKLQKQVTDNANEAIIHILERIVIEGEGWDETLQKDINADNFVKFILGSGYISDDRGWSISIHEFWTNYEEIKNGIFNAKDFEVTKNGDKTENIILVEKEDIVSVTCFADKWNKRQYFLETAIEWVFFSWSTGV